MNLLNSSIDFRLDNLTVERVCAYIGNKKRDANITMTEIVECAKFLSSIT